MERYSPQQAASRRELQQTLFLMLCPNKHWYLIKGYEVESHQEARSWGLKPCRYSSCPKCRQRPGPQVPLDTGRKISALQNYDKPSELIHTILEEIREAIKDREAGSR